MKQNNSNRNYRNYRWSAKKFFKNMAILFSIITMGTILLTTAVNATFEKTPAKVAVITVMRGDTLWSIAQRIDPSADPRNVICKIKQQNMLPSSNLSAGQQLEYELEQ
ncbi:MAG TPA: LysM peptidoglycan-binding domain-containing protein [Bacillota bacterium]|nr:LysM peptidoglycan-binding domain-containing protein [Bacillota bacterium]